MKRVLISLAVLAVCIATPACTAVRKDAKGTWTYVNLLNKKSINAIDLGSDGSLKVKGYQSDAAEAIKAASEGAARGVISATTGK